MDQYISLVLAYLIGSIPFGMILTYMSGGGNIRKFGSGNIGATNVLRSGNKGLALLTLLLDIFKGFIVINVVQNHFHSLDLSLSLLGLAAVMGHMFPIWLYFQGGKGVATALGVLIALNHYLGAVFVGVWIICFLVSGYSSVSSMLAIITTTCLAFFYFYDSFPIFLIITGLIILKHIKNIMRLIKGKEHKFKFF